MYLGLVAALAIILVLSSVSFMLVSHVRFQQHAASLSQLSTYLIAQELARNPAGRASLEAQSGTLITVTDPQQQAPVLNRGYAVVMQNSDSHFSVRAAFQGTPEIVVRYPVPAETDTFLEALGPFVAEQMQQTLTGVISQENLKSYASYSGFPLTLVERPASANGLIKDSGHYYYRFPVNAGQQQIELGPLDTFSTWSLPVVMVLLISALMLTGLGLYRSVTSFETRLRKLQQATTRLAQGHLNARVSTRGQDQVSQLGGAFNKMAEHIQRLMDIQREMIRAVSHELRTPVARIRFAAQLIEDTVMDDPFVTKQLAGMDSDIQELDTLIDEILTYARLEEGGPVLDFQAVNVAEIAEQVVGEARPPKDVTTSYGGDEPDKFPASEAEPRYVHRAIQNLVGNAGRYASSTVIVTCSVADDICRVDVEDDGPGIPEEDWDRVFSAFARLDDSRTRASGGYGLGLSIVRRIMFWHGGRAMVSRSELLGGAKFSLIWPRVHEESTNEA